MRYLQIAGTWGRERSRQRSVDDPLDWFVAGSGFCHLMASLGHERHDQNDDRLTRDPGYWSGEIGFTRVQRWFPWADHLASARAAMPVIHAELTEIADSGVTDLLAITHSHAGNVLAYTLAHSATPLRLHVLDIDMPVQRGFIRNGLYAHAIAQVVEWRHCYSGRGLPSMFRWLGNAFGPRRVPGAVNVEITGGHSGALDAGQPHIAQIQRILADMDLAA